MRIALKVEYNGTHYHGYQAQEGVITLQETLEQALSKVANCPIETFCAGRTDKGVHATGQIVHFDTKANRPIHAWLLGTNTYLPDDIKVIWSNEVQKDFHARFSAQTRAYRYVILNRQPKPGILTNLVTWHPHKLDEKRMHIAAQHLVGEHDFTSFRAIACQAQSPVRTIHNISVTRQGEYVIMDILGNGFLHHMVRNIIGTLLPIGEGKKAPNTIETILENKDRQTAGITASPCGLYLTNITYDEAFGVPETLSETFLL